jgi:hypothetical protein
VDTSDIQSLNVDGYVTTIIDVVNSIPSDIPKE